MPSHPSLPSTHGFRDRVRSLLTAGVITAVVVGTGPSMAVSAAGPRSPQSVIGSRVASSALRVVPGTASQISYTGRWRQGRTRAPLGGRILTSRETGATATLTFTGSEIWWVGRRGPAYGRAKVYVDGRLVRQVRTFAARRTAPRPLFHKRWARPGTHTIRIEVAGVGWHRAVAVEAFVVATGRVIDPRPTAPEPAAPKPAAPKPDKPKPPAPEPDPEPVPESPSYDAVFTGDATGSRDVTAALRSFLESHNGQRVALAKDGVYRVTQLSFTARGLTVDFRGARLVGSLRGAHGILRIQSSTDVVLNDPQVHGTGYSWDPDDQSEHGIQIDGGSGIVLNRPVTRDTRGDGIYISYQAGKNEPATGVVIRDPDIQRASRNGIAPVAGEVTIRGGRIARTGLHSIDFEPNNDQGARSIRGVVDGVDVRRHGDLPAIEPSSYAVAAGGYSTDTKPSMLVQRMTGDSLRITIRNTAKVIVRDNVSDRSTTANFPGSDSISFTDNVRISRQ